MKLCRECIDAIFEITDMQKTYGFKTIPFGQPIIDNISIIMKTKELPEWWKGLQTESVPSSSCQFWAHKKLNDERKKNPLGQWSDPTARGDING